MQGIEIVKGIAQNVRIRMQDQYHKIKGGTVRGRGKRRRKI